jgi:hypothetical protein
LTTDQVVSAAQPVAVSQVFVPPSLAMNPCDSNPRRNLVGKFTDWNEVPEPLLPATGQNVASLLKTTLPSCG